MLNYTLCCYYYAKSFSIASFLSQISMTYVKIFCVQKKLESFDDVYAYFRKVLMCNLASALTYIFPLVVLQYLQWYISIYIQLISVTLHPT